MERFLKILSHQQMQNRKSVLRNNRGILTIDFLIAMTLAFGLVIMMFAFATSLTMIEVAQYMAYSAARAHSAAHLTQEKQVQMGKQKFESYLDKKKFAGLAPLLRNGWFDVNAKTLEIRGGGKSGMGSGDTTFNSDYGYRQNALPQMGVRFKFQAKLLQLKLPLVGAIDGDDEFGTFITGLMLREPSTEECKNQMQMEQRFKAIKALDGRFSTNAVVDTAYFPMEDNGC